MRANLLAALLMAPIASAQQAPSGPVPASRPSAPSSEAPSRRPPAPPVAASSDRGSAPAEAQAEAPATRLEHSPPDLTDDLDFVGVLREFVDGHPDLRPGRPPGRHLGIVADRLDGEGKPVFISRGYRVLRPARDAAGEPIIGPRRYIDSRRGDRAPKIEPVEGEAVQSAWSVNSLFRHSAASRASVHRVAMAPPAAGDDAHSAAELDLACPHIPDGRGRPATARTLELTGRFTHRAGAGRRLRFASADHLWVFVDGWLVIDLGGCDAPVAGSAEEEVAAPRAEQSIDLDRLTWLRDGEEYVVKVFCAARSGEMAPMRIETSASPLAGPSASPADSPEPKLAAEPGQ